MRVLLGGRRRDYTREIFIDAIKQFNGRANAIKNVMHHSSWVGYVKIECRHDSNLLLVYQMHLCISFYGKFDWSWYTINCITPEGNFVASWNIIERSWRRSRQAGTSRVRHIWWALGSQLVVSPSGNFLWGLIYPFLGTELTLIFSKVSAFALSELRIYFHQLSM